MTDAINSNALPKTNEVGYVNLWAAKALQVRVYMTKGEWSKALSVAEDIISNSSYKLWEPSEYVAAWSKSDANHSKKSCSRFPSTTILTGQTVKVLPTYMQTRLALLPDMEM